MEFTPSASAPRRALATLIALCAGSCATPDLRVAPAGQEPLPHARAAAEQPGREGSFDELVELLADSGGRPVAGVWAPEDGALPELLDAGAQDPVDEGGSAESEAPAEGAPAPAGPEPAPAESEGAAAPVEAEPVPVPIQDPPPNPYLEFGERILVHPDGRITKPFPLPPGRGVNVLNLMLAYLDHPVKYDVYDGTSTTPKAPTIEEVGPDEVEVLLFQGYDVAVYENMRNFPPTGPARPVPLADWFMVTARRELLLDVEDFVNTFVARVPQVEIEAKIVELTETDSLDIGLGPQNGLPIFDFPDGTLVQDFSFDLSNAESANEAILNLGAIHDETVFNMVLEAIATWENVSIMSQPRIVVREGSRADIQNTQDIPFYSFSGINATGSFNATLAFKPVGVQLYVVPRVLGTDTISLHIDIEASQQTATAITFASDNSGSLSTPIIAKRTARTVVHLQPGQAVILGGLTTERVQDTERKVPVLGDLPIVGNAFKSKFKRSERVHVLFFIRPRILQGAEFQQADVFDGDF